MRPACYFLITLSFIGVTNTVKAQTGSAQDADIIDRTCPIGSEIEKVGTLIASRPREGNNGSANKLAFVQDTLGAPNIVEQICSFSGRQQGIWTSSSEVTHIIITAADIQQLVSVDSGTSGRWSTECIKNSDLDQPRLGTLSCYELTKFVKIKFKKKVVGIRDKWSFTFRSPEIKNFTLNKRNPESEFIEVAAGASISISEVRNEGFELDSLSCSGDTHALAIQNSDIANGTFDFKAKDASLIRGNEEIICTSTSKTINNTKLTIRNVTLPRDTGDFFSYEVNNLISATLKHDETSNRIDLEPDQITTIRQVESSGYRTKIDCRNGRRVDEGTSISFTPERGEKIDCVFLNFKKTDSQAEDITKLYINRRLENILSLGPDRSRIVRRLDEVSSGRLEESGGSRPLNLTGTVKGGSTDVALSTSLSQIRAAAASAASKKIANAGLSFDDAGSDYTPHALAHRFDLWVEGQIASYDDTTGGISREGNFNVLYFGMDYAIAPGVVFGGLVQYDHTGEDVLDPDITGSVEGSGWMAGPYIGVKLRNDLLFDARAAWGQSYNEISLIDAKGLRTGKFDTTRWIATASLTGSRLYGNFRISPQISVEYGNEISQSYFTNELQKVNSVDVTLGRLAFGPEFGYVYDYEDGISVEPHMSVKGIWTFIGNELELSTGSVSFNDLQASVEGGITIRSPDGYAMSAGGSYYGIGEDDLEAWSGKILFNIPLN